MTLVWLIAIPLVGGILSFALSRFSALAARVLALVAMTAQLSLAITLWPSSTSAADPWLQALQARWIPQLGISFSLTIDGLSLLLILLTGLLGIVSVGISWSQIDERVGLFHLNLLWVLAGVTGVFLAMDLFLFYFFWELMLIPMYFLIDLWGHERRHYAAIKFFLFTQLSGLLMLVAIVALFFTHLQQTGVATFEYQQLLSTPLAPLSGMLMMLGFLVAFAVKLPVVPLHTWLPDAHTQAPTAGSVVLAGLLLKTGGYGLIRFVVPLFPEAARAFSVPALVLAVIGILYGAHMAFAQTDMKRLIAYTSVSHLGFVLLGVFTWNALALQGAVIQMLSHGVSTGALFVLAGILQHHLGTRDMAAMGGLWRVVPRLGAAMMFFSMAALGLPGMGNFIGEFLTLLGTYHLSVSFAVVAAAGLILALVYSLWLLDRVLYGPSRDPLAIPDLRASELAIVAALALAILCLGLAPQAFLNISAQALDALLGPGGAP
ncbi:MAG: NADH-quinone oxidoreductase subunit M [Armatimonadia bacterium]